MYVNSNRNGSPSNLTDIFPSIVFFKFNYDLENEMFNRIEVFNGVVIDLQKPMKTECSVAPKITDFILIIGIRR